MSAPAPPPPPPLLAVRGLRVAYGPVQAVRGIDFEVPTGAIVTLIGANGAGKSSTLAAVSGLLRPQAGSVLLDGSDVTRFRPAQLVERGVVLVPEGRAILAQMSVLENLFLGGYRRADRQALGTEVEGMLARFPLLRERRRAPAGSLSGGEQQQLAIARGLLAKPRLLLLDEPSMGLAPRVVAQIFRLVADIRREGVTVLLVEQNARRALAVADHGYVLETGRVVLSGPSAVLAADQRVQEAYLGGSVAAPPIASTLPPVHG